MTISQSNTAPITTNNSLQIVTLKNLVALDLIEKNEAVLKSFGMFDDSARKLTLKDPLTKEQVQTLIKERQPSISVQEELKQYKDEVNSKFDSKSKQLLESLAAEFLEDEIPIDNTGHLIRQFEKENNVRVIIDDGHEVFYRIESSSSLKDPTNSDVKNSITQELSHTIQSTKTNGYESDVDMN